jgi:hypothetical protein
MRNAAPSQHPSGLSSSRVRQADGFGSEAAESARGNRPERSSVAAAELGKPDCRPVKPLLAFDGLRFAAKNHR